MENRKQLYQERTISMCIENAFDFVRVNISSWLFLFAWLLALPSLILAFLFTKSHFEYNIDGMGLIPSLIQSLDWFFFVILFLGLWVTVWASYTLLEAYFDNRLPGKRLSLKEAWHYSHGKMGKTLSIMVLAAILFFPMTQHAILFLIVLIIGLPLLLLAPIWIVEKTSYSDAIQKTFRLGFTAWFKIFVLVLLVMLLCSMMMLSVSFPWLIYEMLIENVWIPNGVTTSSMFLIQIIELLLTALFFYVFFLMASVVVFSCVFYYGSVSESIDDTTLENDIENFENL